MPEYEYIVEGDVDEVGSHQNGHRHLGVAYAFEKLLECAEEHHGQRAVSHKTVVGTCHIDHLARLPEMVQEWLGSKLHSHNGDSDSGIKDYRTLQIVSRFAPFALNKQFAHKRRYAERDAHAEVEQDIVDDAAECHSRERNRVFTAVGTRHRIVGKCYGNVAELRHGNGDCQPQSGEVLGFVSREKCHCLSIRLFIIA